MKAPTLPMRLKRQLSGGYVPHLLRGGGEDRVRGAGAPEGPVLARLLSLALSVPVPWQANPTDEKGQGPSQTFGPRLAAPPPKAELVCVLG